MKEDFALLIVTQILSYLTLTFDPKIISETLAVFHTQETIVPKINTRHKLYSPAVFRGILGGPGT